MKLGVPYGGFHAILSAIKARTFRLENVPDNVAFRHFHFNTSYEWRMLNGFVPGFDSSSQIGVSTDIPCLPLSASALPLPTNGLDRCCPLRSAKKSAMDDSHDLFEPTLPQHKMD